MMHWRVAESGNATIALPLFTIAWRIVVGAEDLCQTVTVFLMIDEAKFQGRLPMAGDDDDYWVPKPTFNGLSLNNSCLAFRRSWRLLIYVPLLRVRDGDALPPCGGLQLYRRTLLLLRVWIAFQATGRHLWELRFVIGVL